MRRSKGVGELVRGLSPLRIGIDTGGTFTDAVASDGRRIKVRSRPEAPEEAIAAALEHLAPDGPVELVHGTTVATNALLERRLPPVGVLAPAGCRDLLVIGRQSRPDLYALEPRRPWIPTSSALSREVPGRLLPDGTELEPFDAAACRRAAEALIAAGARAIAVVFLHSYANPAHERAAGEVLRNLGVPFTLSSALSPEFREVERGLAAVINAALRPETERYLTALERRLTDRVDIRVMTSDGGLAKPGAVAHEPARLLVSGPAGGLIAVQAYAQALGRRRLLSLDMGGTSTDVAFYEGELSRAPCLSAAGLSIRLPTLDLHTVGAGGGSLALPDAGGALRVGPESAGAKPGPAAYGEGERITVTDAHLLLGHLPPEYFAAGAAALDIGRAERIARVEAKKFRLSLRRFLDGVLELADLSMARALRVMSLERGRDPADASLFVFGGAGGLHGCTLARAMGMREVVVPAHPGVLAAQGLLWAAPSKAMARTCLRGGLPKASEWNSLFGDLEGEAMAALDLPKDTVRFHRSVDLRYRGQSFELELPLRASLERDFHVLHRQRFGFADAGRPLELVTLRVRAEGKRPRIDLGSSAAAVHRRAKSEGAWRSPVTKESTPVFDRERLRLGERVSGPAILADRTGTTWLPAGASAEVGRAGALLLEVRA